MLMPASAEFVAICQSQLLLLTQSLGITLGAVYLAEDWAGGDTPKLVAIAAVPSLEAATATLQRLAHTSSDLGSPLPPSLAGQDLSPEETNRLSQQPPQPALSSPQPPLDDLLANHVSLTTLHPHQLVLPLVHDEIVLGFLVTERNDRPWLEIEQQKLEPVANTLTLACVVDQRAQWLDYQQRQQLHHRQHRQEVMDNLIHQFRNPLTALRTFGKLLLKRLATTDGNRDVAASIVRESDRLQELLKQLEGAIEPPEVVEVALPPAMGSSLMLSPATVEDRPEPMWDVLGTGGLQVETCSVESILEPLLLSAQAIAQDKNQTFQVDIAKSLPWVKVDRSALREVSSNLIDNAIKYTPAGGTIHVRVTQEAQQIAFRVSDNGPGIPPEDLPHLFERHYRGIQAHTEVPGTGLGLAIAQELIHQMNGQIQVFSPPQPEGWISQDLDQVPVHGTTLLVILPIVV
ncbi:sensor histidine kinase [Alkalinema pantanalense CENA528]|uniref:sensor histidine kinase n=1 Tax=Alkalinema pantanalense TaxID=1620705 RepID=UPI003D6F4356